MKRTLAITLAIVAMALVAFVPTAHAGGWAVTTMDDFTVPAAGQKVDIGFTILQHGVTPVDLTEDVGIRITSPSGKVESFPAHLDGATGHYVATVVFPEAGDSRWSVSQGWFAPQDLGTITISSSGSAAASSDGNQSPAIVRYGLPILATALAAFAVFDLVLSRRRKRLATA